MTLLRTLVRTPLAGALGWTLLHSLWEGAALAALLGAALLMMRSPRARYAAACLSMVVMFAGFTATLIRIMPESRSALRVLKPPASTSLNAQPVQGASGAWDPTLTALAPWLAPFWAAGVLVFYIRHAAGLIWVRRLRRRGVCAAPQRWRNDIGRLRARLRVARPVELLESCLAEAPMVLGHFRPMILMPVGLLTGLPLEQIEAILLHELAHIRRCDYLVNALQRVVEGLFFYHPAVWWISRVIRAERENCCDDMAVSISGAHEYAMALAALEQNRCRGRVPAVAATGGSVVNRVHRLLYPQTSGGGWAPFLASVIVIATAAIPVAAWQSNQTPAQPPDGAATSVYTKWLNEDVVYIIDDSERASFLKLSSDEERNKFIEQFWARRDPTPGTPENEFKEEHYRRIAYANEHFAAASLAGWRTDRGHMYINYGPPDEIQNHWASAQNPYGTQVWIYRHMDRIGDNVSITFVDRTGRGDFRMAPGKAR